MERKGVFIIVELGLAKEVVFSKANSKGLPSFSILAGTGVKNELL